MRRIFVALILIVSIGCFVGCNKVQKELENRHLSSGHNTKVLKDVHETIQKKVTQIKDTVKPKDDSSKCPRKELVIRLEWPEDEKVQIRLIKNSESEKTKPKQSEQNPSQLIQNIVETKPESKQNPEPKSEVKPDRNVKSNPKTESKYAPKSELKSEPESKPKSEMKSEQIMLHEKKERSSLGALSRLLVPRPVKLKQAPIQPSVGVAPVIVEAPKVTRPPVVEPIGEEPSPWIIPNAHYPLRLE